MANINNLILISLPLYHFSTPYTFMPSLTPWLSDRVYVYERACVWHEWVCGAWWRGVAWPVLGRVITPKAAGPKHLACVDYAGGRPMWKRRAMARYPPEDHEHLVALCRAEQAEAERDPGRSLSLICHPFPCSVYIFSCHTHSVILTHSYDIHIHDALFLLALTKDKTKQYQTCKHQLPGFSFNSIHWRDSAFLQICRWDFNFFQQQSVRLNPSQHLLFKPNFSKHFVYGSSTTNSKTQSSKLPNKSLKPWQDKHSSIPLSLEMGATWLVCGHTSWEMWRRLSASQPKWTEQSTHTCT